MWNEYKKGCGWGTRKYARGAKALVNTFNYFLYQLTMNVNVKTAQYVQLLAILSNHEFNCKDSMVCAIICYIN